ncbi:MAG TPA: glycosyltransferase [Candidatus Solibacter sp.]|nr:glycosyltransferase [Candidatus Solibacter sp.]
MLTIAYLANLFPTAIEPYVLDEIEELRRKGVQVIAGSVRKPALNSGDSHPEIVLQPLDAIVLWRAFWLCLVRWHRISSLIRRVLFAGNEGPIRRAKALLHTWMGACYAIRLHKHQVDHIHVHHGYFGSWIAMVAARLLELPFSMTLHGSDLLLHGVYLDVKLANCASCFTISNFNRSHIVDLYPEVDPKKIKVSRLGVEVCRQADYPTCINRVREADFSLLAVGRLHATKNYGFLITACAELDASGVDFECSIAGEGPERRRLETQIRDFGLENRIALLGHVERRQMDSLYDRADVVVLTSRSEGLPLVLMEAMVRGRIVLAPSITGIPELVTPGKTGFLYEPDSLDDFLSQLLLIRSLMRSRDRSPLPHIPSAARQLDWIRHGARLQVCHNFNRKKNVKSFAEMFLSQIA